MRPLHAGAPGPFLAAWTLEPLATLGLAAAAIGYAACLRAARARGRPPAARAHVAAFYAGIAAAAVALLGPLDAFNDDSLAVHMLQHLALTQVAAPLIVLGRPLHAAVRGLPPAVVAAMLRATVGRRSIRTALDVLSHPLAVFGLSAGALAAWHWPPAYAAALTDARLHVAEHATFLGTALWFWWVIVDPIPRRHRASPHAAIAVCFATAAVGDILGALLALSRDVVYAPYRAARPPWGLDPLADQHLAGWIMWLGGALYFAAMVAIAARAAAGTAEGGSVAVRGGAGGRADPPPRAGERVAPARGSGQPPAVSG